MRKSKKIERKIRNVFTKQFIINNNISRFKYLILFVALSLSGIAAFFSVYGLSHLFSASKISVILMMSVLELSKLVNISVYYRYNKKLYGFIKKFLLSSIIFLICITSLGIYSYLSNAYQMTSNKLEENSKIELLKRKEIEITDSNIVRLEKRIDILNKRYDSIYTSNVSKEDVLSEAYKINNRRAINEVNNSIDKNRDILVSIDTERKELNKELLKFYDEKNGKEREILNLNLDSTNVDIGPLKFLSKLFNYEINKIVNILILALIFTFDPLAIILLLVFNIIISNEEKVKVIPKRVYKKKKIKTRKLV